MESRLRPIPIYDRKKNTRTWLKDDKITLESYFEDAVHFIILTILVDLKTKTIEQIKTHFLRSPYPDICPMTSDEYKKIIGLKIEKGLTKAISEKIQTKKCCTHLQALLKEAADAFVQTLFKLEAKDLDGKERRDVLIKKLRNSCFAYSDEMN